MKPVRRADLDRLLSFEKRTETNDGMGNTVDTYAAQFSEPTGIAWRRGGEEVEASRLKAEQPCILTLNRNARTELIDATWRAVGDRRIYRIVEMPTLTQDRRHLQMLAIAEKKPET